MVKYIIHLNSIYVEADNLAEAESKILDTLRKNCEEGFSLIEDYEREDD